MNDDRGTPHDRNPIRPSLMVVTNSAYTLSGLATWLDYLLPGLAQGGWNVTLGLVSGPRHHRPDRYLQVHPFADVVAIHCDCSTPLGRVAAVRKAIADVEPDLVLTVNIPDAIRATALERSAGRRVRAVMSCHGIQEDLFADMQTLVGDIDAVVCTNRLACRLAQRLGTIDPARVFHCAYGTPVPDTLPPWPQRDVFTIGYSGRLEADQKRIGDLVAIAMELRRTEIPFRFLVAGSGPEEAALRVALQQENLDGRFELLGFIAAEQLQQRLYRAVDVLLVTSSWETGPIVIWEAMAAGTPVVSSRYIGSGQERLLWHDRNCLTFAVGDVREAASQLISLQDDANKRETIRQQALQTVQSQLSCQVSVDQWNRVLRQILQLPDRHVTMTAVDADPPGGRLDRVLGRRGARWLRRMLGKLPPDSGPGGEWPHTISGESMPPDEFWALAQRLDQRTAAGEPAAW